MQDVPPTVEKICKCGLWATNYVFGEGEIENGKVYQGRSCLECVPYDF